MRSLLIVELTSSKVRFLQVHSSQQSQILTSKSFKNNKNLTKQINYLEFQKINDYIKNTINARKLNSLKVHIYAFEDFPPLFLSRTKLLYATDLNTSIFSIKRFSYLLKEKTVKDEIQFIFYNDKIYIAYYLNKTFVLKIFFDLKELSSQTSFRECFLHRLILFDVPLSIVVKVLIDKDFPVKSWNLSFLYKYFRSPRNSTEILDFPAYLYFKA